ncbi:MAG: DUF1269 domain-containing protein [Anaerolineae bacterium]
MSELVVVAFDNETGAAEMRDALIELQKQQLVTLDDAAVVVRGTDGKVKVKQAVSLVGAGALGGAFWGMLIGLLFFVPFFGAAVGAAMGALAGKFSDYGIDDDFIKTVQGQVTEGTSALFLMTSEAVVDKVADAMKAFDFEIIATNLSKKEEDNLRAAFA